MDGASIAKWLMGARDQRQITQTFLIVCYQTGIILPHPYPALLLLWLEILLRLIPWGGKEGGEMN